jgi:Winged helix DNA-binding domain
VGTSESQAAARPDDQAVTAKRCAAQLLGGDPAGSAEEVAGRLLAVQAQDLRGARLAIRARSAGAVRLRCRRRPRAALADRHLAEPPNPAPGPVPALPPPLLLGAFDPLLLGWASRDAIVGPHHRIVTVNGLFRPFALASGRAVATWNIARGQVVLAPFAPLDDRTQAALNVDAADVMRFLAG